ncbi:MAG: helix-hairpin-helix domain-containing protein [Desulfobulbaceae bacterium]|nr:helix-hairpin-helix domain-containing protein [Desulfobulbaceae bacterium]
MKKALFALFFLLFFATATFAKVNINTATVQELTTLPGIGPAKAEAIIKHREANGPFKTVDELGNVKGVGPKTLQDLRSEVSTDN